MVEDRARFIMLGQENHMTGAIITDDGDGVDGELESYRNTRPNIIHFSTEKLAGPPRSGTCRAILNRSKGAAQSIARKTRSGPYALRHLYANFRQLSA